MSELQQVILAVLAPDTWVQAGGEGSLVQFGNSLVIRQTAEVHREISGLLKQLRSGVAAQKTVSIDARWLLLNSDDLDRLISSHQKGCPLVNRDVLAEYTRRPSSIRAITNCFSGQLVYLIGGTQRNFVSGYTPVVGSVDSPEQPSRQYASLADDVRIRNASYITPCNDPQQFHASGSRPAVGYQPITEKKNLGALLEVRATLIPKDNRAVVDLRSTITMPEESTLQGSVFGSKAPPDVDRVAINTQEFATTLSLPMGKPVLAGGITYVAPTCNLSNNGEKTTSPYSSSGKNKDPKSPVAREVPQLYLVLEIR